MKKAILLLSVLAIGLVSCGSSETEDSPVSDTTDTAAGDATEAAASDTIESDVASTESTRDGSEVTAVAATQDTTVTDSAETVSFTAEVWADNWFALYVNGELVGEDSVPITTERSFNAETVSFEAPYPLTIAIEAKDFTETDSGLEYIGESNQQMGDGGIIAQITNDSTGEIVAVTSSAWSALVVHQAPLNTECEDAADPDATCEFLITETPADWTSADFDDRSWAAATEWSAAAVDPKGGYDEIVWDASAQLIWGSDLEVDNIVLLRLSVAG